MSMAIDLSSPLTRDERAYLAERGRYADIERADALTGVTDSPDLGSGDGTGLQLQPLGTAEQRAARRAQLEAELAALSADDEEDVDPEDDDELPPYSEWTVPALDAELKRRSLSVNGTKPEKVKRLEDDDTLNAE